MSRIALSISEVEVLKTLQKPWTISLAQRWIREDRDQSKLMEMVADCVNLMGLRTSVRSECMVLKFFSFTFVKMEQYFRPRSLE